ncbi:VWA domain-containing protein [Thermodesulfobacteriota bacterium]
MFIDFFYRLREQGIPVSPTAFLTLNRALFKGLIGSVDDFYIAARSILVKSERYFDQYDQVFAYHFEGASLPPNETLILDEIALQMLHQWTQNPEATARLLGESEEYLQNLSADELLAYFLERLQEQKGAHHGGSKWIGTGGTSPVGHSGYHPGGMRIGGESLDKSALKVANTRRYRDYSGQGPLNQARIGEALKRLRKLVPAGARDRINIEKTITRTVKIGGEIEIVFEQDLKDRLKVILAIDNGGWSMEPHVKTVQTLFDYARTQFKELKTYYFHNTIYDTLWKDPSRSKKPYPIDDLQRLDPETRFIIMGDASMAPFELATRDGSIHIQERNGRTSLESLQYIAKTFSHIAWLNPIQENMWRYSPTIAMIQQVFPMFELSLDGLEKAVSHLTE